MLVVGMFAELVSNDRPLVARYHGEWFFPIVNNPPETRFGGDFLTPTDWHDPLIREQFAQRRQLGAVHLQRIRRQDHRLLRAQRRPGAPGQRPLLGTDDAGRDMVARLLYGFRISILFGLALTIVGTLLGILIGARAGLFRRAHRPRRAARDRDLELDARSSTC